MAEETLDEFSTSFWYGSRSNLTFKFLKDLDGVETGEFLQGFIIYILFHLGPVGLG